MASGNKFRQFVEDLAKKVHNLNSDTLKVLLSNVAPVNTNSVKADLTEITAEHGYSAGGPTATFVSGSQAAGTYTLTLTNTTTTASGGTVGPFRYIALYNDTPTSPADPLIGWWDYASSITLQDTDTFTVAWNGGGSSGSVLTLV